MNEVSEHLPPRRRRRRNVVGIIVAAIAIVAVGVTVVLAHGPLDSRRDQTAPTTVPLSTVAVTRMDLADTTSFDGSLAYGSPLILKGAGTGTVTKLPAVGTIARRGVALYSVNDKPVLVLFGDTPLFRPIGTVGMAGSDVAMVASNLAALGLIPPVTESDPAKVTWTNSMRKALGNLQAWLGLAVTRTLAVGDVVVLAGPLRVDSVLAHTGDPVGTDLLTLTSEHRSVTLQIDPADARPFTVGVAVTVTLGNGTTVPAQVTSITSATVLLPAGGATVQHDSNPKTTVTIDPDDDTALTTAESPVRVSVTTRKRSQVLTVPVDALLGLREGGYALQTTDGRLIPVTLGMISGDRVEISGSDLTAGLTVVTAT